MPRGQIQPPLWNLTQGTEAGEAGGGVGVWDPQGQNDAEEPAENGRRGQPRLELVLSLPRGLYQTQAPP